MLAYDISEISILALLSKYENKISTNDLFELLVKEPGSSENAVPFIKTLNSLFSRELVQITLDDNALIHWKISEPGKDLLTNGSV